MLIVSTDALDGAGTRLRQHKAAVAAAAKAGVGRIAYTSLPNADTSKVSFAPDHLGTEQAIKATGLPYLIFRNSWYAENLFMSLPNALKSGQWYTSAGKRQDRLRRPRRHRGRDRRCARQPARRAARPTR